MVEKTGAIRVVEDGRTLPQPFLDISDKVSGGSEQGLLSMAFAPDYARSGRFYVDYTDTDGDTRVVSYRRSPDDPLRADPGSARVVLAQDQPYDNHNGGQLAVRARWRALRRLRRRRLGGRPGANLAGPLDRARQDRPPRRRRPRRRSRGSTPSGCATRGASPSIRASGALAIGDVGQDRFEEVDYVRNPRPGMNFGWSAFEGDARYNRDQQAPGAIPPVLVYSHDQGCSVTGGYVIRDPRLPACRATTSTATTAPGSCASSCRRERRAKGRRRIASLGLEVPQLTSFGEDSRGRIYAASQAGPVYRIDPCG